ncbi:MAG TPA: hypothetical protein VJH92_03220 [Candidatus Nanoarchaeia archaeon]|nr:hypothetical protein [Candidatus Nanoarchaeia archaeon]
MENDKKDITRKLGVSNEPVAVTPSQKPYVMVIENGVVTRYDGPSANAMLQSAYRPR